MRNIKIEGAHKSQCDPLTTGHFTPPNPWARRAREKRLSFIRHSTMSTFSGRRHKHKRRTTTTDQRQSINNNKEIQPYSHTTMPRRKYANDLALVSMRMEAEFERRCKKVLQDKQITPSSTPFQPFGTRVLMGGEETYVSRLRAFIQFLFVNPQFDDSLAVFYAFTPPMTLTVEAKAVTTFLYSKCAKKGEPLVDAQVSQIVSYHMI